MPFGNENRPFGQWCKISELCLLAMRIDLLVNDLNYISCVFDNENRPFGQRNKIIPIVTRLSVEWYCTSIFKIYHLQKPHIQMGI